MSLRTTGLASSAFRFRKASESPARQLIQELRQRLAATGSAAPDRFSPLLHSLASERNAGIFFESLINVGRQVAAEDPSRAGIYFQFLSSLEAGPWKVPDEVRKEARAEEAALRGEGSFGRQAERMGQRLIQETNLGTVVGMGVATTLFSGCKLVGLSQLVGRPASFLTRGWAARFLASAAAFPAELGSFWLTDRLYRQAVRPGSVTWSWEAASRELVSLSLTLGLMKLGGAAGGGLFERVHGAHPLTGEISRLAGLARFSRPLFQQAGMYAGIVGGHWAEKQRSGESHDGLWSGALLTLAEFYVAGKVSEGLLGPNHAALMREMALRTRGASETSGRRQGWRPLGYVLGGERLALVSERISPEPSKALTPESSRDRGIVMMNGNKEGGSGDGAPSVAPPAESGGFFIQFADPPWELTPPLEAVLESLRTNAELTPEQRAACATELYRHYPRVREILEQRLEQAESGVSRAERLYEVELVLQEIKRCHFEGISDELHIWYERFRFLQSQLRLLVETGTRRERVATRRILDSVNLKLLETRRYHLSAESYLGDSKEPGPKDPFSDGKYPDLVQKFTGILERLGEYLVKRPELAALLETYSGRLMTSFERQVSPRMFEAALAPLGLEAELQDMLCDFRTEDPFLQHFDMRAVYRLVRHITQLPLALPYVQAPEPLNEYLQACLALQNTGIKLATMAEPLGKLARLFDKTELPADRDFDFESRHVVSAAGDERAQEARTYVQAAKIFAGQLYPYHQELRNWMGVKWPEVRAQLSRLGRRGVLTTGTANGLLRWFDPPDVSSGNRLLLAARQDAVAGLIDFVGKGTHSSKTREEIATFLREVVRRRDEKMLEILAIYFQDYQLGIMRDRIQVREDPADDALTDTMAVEAYDRFLEAIQKTARFYSAHPKARGLFLEIFDKLARNKRDHHYQLAVPIWHRCRALLDAGCEIHLFSRGGMGEAVLSATHPTWGDRMIAVTSSLGALGSRGELEAQLDRAERELEHNRNGREYPRFIYIHLPHIRSGVAKENVLQWVADYLHDHSQLAGVDVYLPKKGYEVADVVVQKFYRRVAVTRESIESTVDKMERLGEEVEGETDKLKERLELYRLRKSWIEILTCRLRTWADSNPLELAAYRRETRKIQELERLNLDLLHRTDELHPGENFIQDEKKRVLGNWSRSIENNDLNYLTGREPVSGMPEPVGESDLEARKYLFLDFFGYAMEVYLSPNRVENLIDLALVHAEVSDLAWKYEKGEVMLNGDIHRLNRVPLLAGAELTESFPVSDEDVALEADSGRFSFKIARVSRGRASQGPRSKERDLEIHLDHLFLPQKMRHQGIGRNFFGELIRLGKDLGAKGILSSDIRDEGRLKLALYGMQFAGLHEFRKLFHYFENFLHDHIRIPGFEGYDLSPLEEIRNPQQFAYAFFDPETRALNLEPPLTAEAREKYRRLPPHHLAGRLYLLSEAPSWDGIFDLRPESESLRIFNSLIASPPWEGQPPRRPDDN